MSQSRARRMFLAYLPVRVVLPSQSSAMPPRAVIVTGYWPPWASQWPSRLFCWLTSHSSDFLTAGRYLTGTPASARAEEAPSSRVPHARAPRTYPVLMDFAPWSRDAHRWTRNNLTQSFLTIRTPFPHNPRRIPPRFAFLVGRVGPPPARWGGRSSP